MTDIDNRLLRSYAHGPRTWDASAIFPEVMNLADQGLIEPVPGGGAYQLTAAGREALRGAQAEPEIVRTVPLPPARDLRTVPPPPDHEDELDEAYGQIQVVFPDLDWDGPAGTAVSRALEDGFQIGRGYGNSHPD